MDKVMEFLAPFVATFSCGYLGWQCYRALENGFGDMFAYIFMLIFLIFTLVGLVFCIKNIFGGRK